MRIRIGFNIVFDVKRSRGQIVNQYDGFIESANVDSMVESAVPPQRLGFAVEHTSEPDREDGGRR